MTQPTAKAQDSETIAIDNSTDLLDLRGLDRAALEALVSELGGQKYRAAQIMRWLHKQDIASIDEMANIPKKLRQDLRARGHLHSLQLDDAQQSKDGTSKLRWSLHDGLQIETVFIPDAARIGRHALCISTQVGCAMGCAFCATGTLKLRRHLQAGEIVEQLRLSARWLAQQRPDERIGSIVFMGMGEPLHNYDNTVAALRILTDPDAHGYSPRRITVSTVGLVEPLSRLLDDVDVQIAVSLIAARDAVRDQLMPVNKKHPVQELLDTCRRLPIKRRRRITFEVVLLAGVNDSDADALALARAMQPLQAKVNLIPFNPHPLADFAPPGSARVLAFQEILRKHQVATFLRQPRGQDIDAACGMLVARHEKNTNKDT